MFYHLIKFELNTIIIHLGAAIKCYVCNSGLNDNCDDEFISEGIREVPGFDYCVKAKAGKSGIILINIFEITYQQDAYKYLFFRSILKLMWPHP